MPFAFFLDRSDGRAPSFAGSNPSSAIVVDADGSVRENHGEGWKKIETGPIEAIADYVKRSQAKPRGAARELDGCTLPRTVGFLGYELGAWIETVKAPRHDTLGLPLALLCTYNKVYGLAVGSDTPIRVDFVEQRSLGAASVPTLSHRDAQEILPAALSPAESDLGDQQRDAQRDRRYRGGFATIQDAISAGDVYQVNLSRRISIEQREPAEVVYARMRDRQSVPHGAYIDVGTFQILSNSPEVFLEISGETIKTLPIKGTRPRGTDAASDARLARELVSDPKENAEHVMIVDLERNDLGRVCQIGTVEVPVFAEVHSFETIHHMVSEVRGKLRPGTGLADVLRASFPGGSITGAPKIKSMEIIADVEDETRGVYTGSVGCFNGERDVDLSIAIRTAVAMNGTLHYNTGGGIVADSTLEAEYEETVAKAEVFRAALFGDKEVST